MKGNHKSINKLYRSTFKYEVNGYIWKSSDKGKTWQKISNGLPENTDVAKIIVK
ncbi:hypothetical protein KFZ70_11230 [Tamlana fucoidanivorans]|uniref:hypothetical protein n=1 Tax=Allotamlana fucoidanivorans TaxID=2583814 RepID=UPI001E6574C2|nr:hypothetical protein [Tamlana fucoidanivorans]